MAHRFPINVLLVDDDRQVLSSISSALATRGLTSEVAASGEEALEKLGEHVFEMMLADVSMPGMSGIELLERARRQWPGMAVVMLSAHQSVPTVVEALKKGAIDYLVKPFRLEELLVRTENVLRHRRLEQEVEELRAKMQESEERPKRLIGQSKSLLAVLEQISMVARNDVAVVIYGESGTGKELVAREIHDQSPRREKRFVVVNCGALSEELLRDELFGHEAGAFTGAQAQKKGLFEVADGGTVFLDEIGEVSHGVQVQLLRVLQSHEFTRLGGTSTIHANVRVISATNRDLAEEVRNGRFREDLYYRINVVPIQVPPLRERRDDIPLLVNHFTHKFKARLDVQPEGFTPEAVEALMRLDWVGNVRELENSIKRLLVMRNDRWIDPAALQSITGLTEPREPVGSLPYREQKRRVLEGFDREYLRNLLTRCGGNVSRAAQAAEIDRKSLWRKLKQYGLNAGQYRSQL